MSINVHTVKEIIQFKKFDAVKSLFNEFLGEYVLMY
jgi:hypothetical protein